jgi:hypothetical protein
MPNCIYVVTKRRWFRTRLICYFHNKNEADHYAKTHKGCKVEGVFQSLDDHMTVYMHI